MYKHLAMITLLLVFMIITAVGGPGAASLLITLRDAVAEASPTELAPITSPQAPGASSNHPAATPKDVGEHWAQCAPKHLTGG